MDVDVGFVERFVVVVLEGGAFGAEVVGLGFGGPGWGAVSGGLGGGRGKGGGRGRRT